MLRPWIFDGFDWESPHFEFLFLCPWDELSAGRWEGWWVCIMSCHAQMWRQKITYSNIQAYFLIFVLNGLLLKTNLLLKISHFSKVSHLGQNQLTLENGLLLKIIHSQNSKPIYIWINMSSTGYFKLSRFCKISHFMQKWLTHWKMVYFQK